MKRRPRTLRSLAIPTAIFQLFADQPARESPTRSSEEAPKREHATVDARLHFTIEERLRPYLWLTQFPVAGPVVPSQAPLEAGDGRFDGRIGAVNAGCAQQQQREESSQPDRVIGPAPRPILFLAGKDPGAEAMVRDTGAFRGDLCRGCGGQVAHRLPTDGGVRIK